MICGNLLKQVETQITSKWKPRQTLTVETIEQASPEPYRISLQPDYLYCFKHCVRHLLDM